MNKEEIEAMTLITIELLIQAPLYFVNSRRAKKKAAQNQRIYREMYREYGY